MELLKEGTAAPDFRLLSTPDQKKVSRSDFLGKNLILAFYPADWSPVCGDELDLFNEVLPLLKKQGAELLGISVDAAWCHLAYKNSKKLRFELLSDFEPKGEVARQYGVYHEVLGISERALFLIDEKGIIRWSYVSPMGVNPGAEGLLDALEANSKVRKVAS